MCFKSEIAKSLGRLKKCDTICTNTEGVMFQETRNESGEFLRTKLSSNRPGFVIDEKPNFTVSRILPWLFFGSQDVTFNYYLLDLYDFTAILSIGVLPADSVDIPTCFIEVYDLPEYDIYSMFDKCISIINSVRNQGGKMYVHCNAGISRSPTIVIAYIMYYFKIGHREALSVVKKVRPSIKPNCGFLEQLKTYETVIDLRK